MVMPPPLVSTDITEVDRLGDGGPKQKFQQNLKAIEVLRALDAEERQATPEEKAALIKYVGWGAMPQVFDDYNREWAKEREALQSRLADDEYEHARSTTLNAHYTAPVVINAMYRALERFGFQHGRVLEPASGIGHFIGLMPEEMLRRSTVTAVEIDPLTARIGERIHCGSGKESWPPHGRECPNFLVYPSWNRGHRTRHPSFAGRVGIYFSWLELSGSSLPNEIQQQMYQLHQTHSQLRFSKSCLGCFGVVSSFSESHFCWHFAGTFGS
jgi:hypothetical protein